MRMRRVMEGMSQTRLGEILGVTFQQIQKYEKGVNRIPASRLKLAADAFSVSVGWFYEGLSSELDEGEGAQPPLDLDFLSTTDGVKLNRAFMRIEDPRVRARIIDLVESLAASPAGDVR